MKKRIIATLLCLIFAISVLPPQAYAMLGAITHVDGIRHKTITVRNAPYGNYASSTPAGEYYMLYNEYICFILRPDGSTTTVPTRLYKEYINSMSGTEYEDANGSIIMHFPVTEQHHYKYARYVFGMHREYLDAPQPHNVEIGTDSLLAHYVVGNDVIASKVVYSLVRVDNGALEGNMPITIVADENDNGRCWGIKMNSFMEYNEDEWNFPDNEHYREDGVGVELITTHLRFAKQSGQTEGGLIELSYQNIGYYENELVRSRIMSKHKIGRIDIPYSDISTIQNGSFVYATEAYTDSFGADNQFVALSSGYYQDVEGHESEIPESVGGVYAEHYSYNALSLLQNYNGEAMFLCSAFTTYSAGVFFLELGLGTDEGSLETSANGLWGFRDMYTGNEYEDIPADPDYTWNIPEGNMTLGIVKDDDEVYATPGANKDALAETYGDDLVAVLRGMFAIDNAADEYVFLNGTVALSPTVAANWDDDGYFRVGRNGEVRTLGVSLTCPAFDFYKPNDEGGLEFDFSDGFTITIDPAKNKSFFNIEIPGATSKVEGAVLKTDGHLTFCGDMTVSNPMVDIASITLSRIGMRFDNAEGTHIEGIEASGSVDMGEIMGAMASNASANINTFDGEEEYGFALDLNIPNLFEAEAELTLVRLNNGSLAPDALMFALSVAAAEIPIAPPALSITGVGGGFRDLAETLNDDPYSLPPLKVSVSMNAKMLEAVEGRGTLTAGLGYCSVVVSNATLLDIVPLGLESTVELFTADETRLFRGKRYSGISCEYYANASMSLPTESNDIFSLSDRIALRMFTGISGSALYLDFDGDGSIIGKVRLPRKLGIMPLPDPIAGYEVASAEIALALSGKAAIDFGNNSFIDTVSDCAESFVGGATLTYKNKLLGIFDTYIVASAGDKSVRLSIGTLGSTLGHTFGLESMSEAKMLASGETKDDKNYSIYSFSNSLLLGSTKSDKSVIGDEELLAINGITMEQIASDESAYTVGLSNIAKNGQLMFVLTPKGMDSTLTESELESMFTVKKAGGTEVPLVFSEYDTESGEETLAGNAYTSVGGYDSIFDEYVDSTVVIMLPDNNETYTITAKDSSDAAVAFDIECVGVELSEDISEGYVKELKDGNEYALRTYFVDSEGESYTVGEDVHLTYTDNGRTVSTLSPIEGVAALDSVPTGSYTVRYHLFRMVRGVDENDEPAFDEFGKPFYYYVDMSEYSGSTVTNINPYQVSDPIDVTIAATGSEVLRAQWETPTDMTSAEIIGYNVAVEQQVNGEWVDTGARYIIDKDDSGNVPTSISMAITASGVDDGLMEAGNTYRAKVSSIVNFDVIEDGNTVTIERTGEGVYSNAVYLAPATPPTVAYNPTPTVNDKNVKSLYTKPGNTISINATALGGKTIASVTATNLNDNSAISVSGNSSFIVPEFDGSLTVKILVRDSVGDMTADYITLLRDDTAPIITLDNNAVIANEDGSYTVSGITEPGATVKVMFTNVPVAADGSFTYNGQLDIEYVEGAVVLITATDAAGNTGSDMLAVGMKLATPIITPESETCFEPFSVEITCANTNAEVRYTLDGTEPTEESTLYVEPFEVSTSVTIKAKAFQAGMGESNTASVTYTFATHVVTFVDWDGTVLDTQTIDHGESATAPENPIREGYEFIGWDKDFTNVVDDMTITAQYAINTHTVTFVDWDGTVLDTQTIDHGGSATAPENPIREGYEFIGWDKDFTNVIDDMTITAQYEQSYVLGDVNCDGVINTGDAVIILRQAVGIVTFSALQEGLADYNGDGTINTGDAVAVLRYCVS